MLRVSLFGQLQARLADEPLALSTATTGRLLAYGLLHCRQPQARRDAARALCPDAAESEALAGLRRRLHALNELARSRGAAGPWIVADRLTIQWNAETDCWVDVEEFDACARSAGPLGPHAGARALAEEHVLADLERAVALYTGDLLEDWYDDWVLAERERRRARFGEVLTRLIGLHAARGDAGSAAECAARLVRLDDLRESAHRCLMGLTYAAGNRDAALAAYDTCCRVLSAELDICPMPQTEHLARAIRDGRPPERILALLRSELPEVGMLIERLGGQVPHNLPQPLTSFVGREPELQSLAGRLRDSRFVTVVGAGGSGKSRLALEVCEAALAAGQFAAPGIAGPEADAPASPYPDGVWWVDLAPVNEPSFVVHAAAAAMGVTEEPGQSVGDTLTRHVRSRRLLLVLDNCEHVRRHAAELAQALLGAGDGVAILATSRVPLGGRGEARWTLAPLTLPAADDEGWPAAVQEYEAPRLFAERAAAVLPGYATTCENAGAVIEVCRKLDGLPLAIELAAARMKVLPAAEIAARLDERFRLLTAGPRTAVPHQQTLRATMDWSHDLLDEAQRRLLRRLSVFRGGWTMDSAAAVCRDTAASDGLSAMVAALVEQSLVSTDLGGEAVRYRMLQTVREYASEHLVAAGEQDRLRDRHLLHFLALAEEADQALRGPEQPVWLRRLEAENDNLRAALQWSLSTDGDAVAGLRMAAALRWFWYFHNYLEEGRSWLERAIEAAPSAPDAVRASALNAAGTLAHRQGDYRAALALFEHTRSLMEQAGDALGVGLVLGNLGMVTSHLGDLVAARSYYERSLGIVRQHGDLRATANALGNLGQVAIAMGDLDAASSYLEDNLVLQRELGGGWGLAASLANLSHLSRLRGDYEGAQRWATESLELYEQLGDEGGAADARLHLGSVAAALHEFELAAHLFEASLAAHRRTANRAGTAAALADLGSVWLERDDHRDLRKAHALLAQGLEIFADIGDKAGVCASLIVMGQTAAAGDDPRRAARLWGAAQRLREGARIGLSTVVTNQDRYVERVRGTLGDAAFEAEWDAGRTLTFEEAIAYATTGRATDTD